MRSSVGSTALWDAEYGGCRLQVNMRRKALHLLVICVAEEIHLGKEWPRVSLWIIEGQIRGLEVQSGTFPVLYRIESRTFDRLRTR